MICRNKAEAAHAARELSKRLPVAESDLEKAVFDKGVMVFPVEYTKGLEFDAVLLLDPDREQYPADDGHAKLLYVAATRALHRLCVLHTGNLTGLIADPVPKKNVRLRREREEKRAQAAACGATAPGGSLNGAKPAGGAAKPVGGETKTAGSAAKPAGSAAGTAPQPRRRISIVTNPAASGAADANTYAKAAQPQPRQAQPSLHPQPSLYRQLQLQSRLSQQKPGQPSDSQPRQRSPRKSGGGIWLRGHAGQRSAAPGGARTSGLFDPLDGEKRRRAAAPKPGRQQHRAGNLFAAGQAFAGNLPRHRSKPDRPGVAV